MLQCFRGTCDASVALYQSDVICDIPKRGPFVHFETTPTAGQDSRTSQGVDTEQQQSFGVQKTCIKFALCLRQAPAAM